MSDLQSFKFFLYHRNGDGSPLDGLILTEATGLIEKPGNISVEANLLLGNLLVKSGIIYIDLYLQLFNSIAHNDY